MPATKDIVTRADAPVHLEALTAPTGPAAVMAMMTHAVANGVPVEALEKISQLYREEQDRAAAREFADAMAQFQSSCPPIPKTSTAKITSATKGTTHKYDYAELDQIALVVGPHLHVRGLSFSWDSATEGANITCTCTLRHRNGHSIRATFSCPTDSGAAMNSQQKHAAALTYAKRQALVQVLGLTMTDVDPDGADPADLEPITQGQVDTLRELIDQTNSNIDQFLKWVGAGSLPEVRRRDFPRALRALQDKSRGKGVAS
ncbi:MAG: ERF family protein [Candidatus Eiseniibacteriota bacterium]